MYEICAKIFGRNIYVRSKFSCVRSSHDMCVRAHTHSLEGTLAWRPYHSGSKAREYISDTNSRQFLKDCYHQLLHPFGNPPMNHQAHQNYNINTADVSSANRSRAIIRCCTILELFKRSNLLYVVKFV